MDEEKRQRALAPVGVVFVHNQISLSVLHPHGKRYPQSVRRHPAVAPSSAETAEGLDAPLLYR